MIFVDEQIPIVATALSANFEVRRFSGRFLTNRDLIDNDASALFVRSTTTVNNELLNGSNVSFVGSATSGIDHIDLDYLNTHSIQFSFAPGSNSQAVCDYVLSILHLLNKVKSKTPLCVGIVGRGHVGSKVDEALQTMSVKESPLTKVVDDEASR